jgi:hypothetical protein
MSKATRAYLKERPVNNDPQGSRSNTKRHSSAGTVAAEQKRTDLIARHPSMQTPSLSTDPGYHINCSSPTEDWREGGNVVSPSDVTIPSRGVSAKPNPNSSIRGQALDGPAGAPRPGIGIHTHSPAPDGPVRDEGGGGIPLVNSSKERGAPSITGNEVTARGRCSAFGYKND